MAHARIAAAVLSVFEAVGTVPHLSRLLSQAQSLLEVRAKGFHGSSRFPACRDEIQEKRSWWGLHSLDRVRV